MNGEELKQILSTGLDDCEVEVQIDGDKLNLDLVSASFSGMSRVKRQQAVYALLGDKISSGEIHAVTMRTMTPDESSGG